VRREEERRERGRGKERSDPKQKSWLQPWMRVRDNNSNNLSVGGGLELQGPLRAEKIKRVLITLHVKGESGSQVNLAEGKRRQTQHCKQ